MLVLYLFLSLLAFQIEQFEDECAQCGACKTCAPCQLCPDSCQPCYGLPANITGARPGCSSEEPMGGWFGFVGRTGRSNEVKRGGEPGGCFSLPYAGACPSSPHTRTAGGWMDDTSAGAERESG